MRSTSLSSASVCLLLLVYLSASLIGCGQSQPALSPVQSWIRQHALPLKTTDPRASLDDLQPLEQIIGNASIVGLGEATHGSHEFFTMKQRLLEFLVEKMGFTMFAMEGSWSAGEQINTYVLTGQGSVRGVVGQFNFWTWNTQEVLDLVQWMRSYDADPRHVQKVRFAGFDCQNIETNTFDQVTQYLQTVDPQSAVRVTTWRAGDQYVPHAEQVYELLRQHPTAYTARSSPQAFAQALQEARVIVQYAQLSLLSVNPNDQRSLVQYAQLRDTFLAENVTWLHEHADGGSKLVLWAHNDHIETVQQGGYTRMGWYLRQRYQSQYLAIGMSFYQGSFNAIGEDSNLDTFTIQAPNPESYNDTFGSVGLSLYALDLRHLPGGSVGQWMKEPHGFLTIGSVYNPAAANTFYEALSLPQSFDVIIHIQQVTASHLLL
jgi:erythromycin esterase